MTTNDALSVLGDPTRRTLVERLRDRPRSVGELAAGLPVTRPAVSQHLAVLRRAGLVRQRRDGTRRIYALDPEGLSDVRAYVEGLWRRALDSYAEAAAREEERMEREESVGPGVRPVRVAVVVGLPPRRAFAVFTERFGEWWPLETHSIAADDPLPGQEGLRPDTAIIEPRAGGRVLERHPDGTQLEWGRVEAWEPPVRLVLSWNPSRSDRPRTEVEVTFQAEGAGTRVELEHRGWERLGPRGEDLRGGYQAGWPVILKRYVSDAVSQGATPVSTGVPD